MSDYEVFGLDLISVFKFALALGIFVGSLFLRKFVVHGALMLLKLVGAHDEVQSRAEGLIGPPLSFATIFGGFYVSAHILQPPQELDHIFAKIAESTVNLSIFWIAYKIIDPIANLWMKTSSGQHDFGEEIKELVTKILKSIFVILGFLAIMEVWGINVAAFLAGLGLMGMAVALAAQDTVKNLFGTFVIIADRIFHKGHMIVTPEVTGIVEHFGIRVTQVRKLDTTLVFVPNATLSNAVITNLSVSKRREISWTPKLAADKEQAVYEDVIAETLQYLKHQDDIENEEATPIVHLTDVTDGTMTLMVYFHFKMLDWASHVAARERVALKFKEIVHKNGASFALPTRNVFVHKA